jgi:hypothetical protein
MKLKAGKYYVGDPCYVLQGKQSAWMKVLEASDYFNKPYTKKGKTAVAFGTAYGDGEYYDQDGNAYPVDAGLIGVVPVSMATRKKPTGVHLVDFKKPFECEQDGSVLKFGHIVIDTDPEDWTER